jgi:hypothetical protein
LAAAVCLAVPIMLTATGCGLLDVGDIETQVESTVSTLTQDAQLTSDSWKTELNGLVDKLTAMESTIDASAKATLASTINDVSTLLNQTLNTASDLVKDTIAFSAIEAQCSVNYFNTSVVSQLRHVLDGIEGKKDPLPTPVVCAFNPDSFSVPANQSANANQTWNTEVYGYNFSAAAKPTVLIQDGQGNTVRTGQLAVIFTSLYQLQVGLDGADLANLGPGYRVTLAFPGGSSNSIPIRTITPASLEVVGFTFPSQVTVGQAVAGQVSVRNTGGVSSGPFTIQWHPNAGRADVVPLSVAPLAAGQTSTYQLPPYPFQQSDYFDDPLHGPYSISTQVVLNSSDPIDTTGSASRAFQLVNVPFPSTPITVTIDDPVVNEPWYDYTYKVPVRPGDVVQIVSAGGCVQTGGSGRTWKRYVDPYAPDSPGLYHGRWAIGPPVPATLNDGTRLQGSIQEKFSIRISASDPQFYLGYEDTGYGDNGYDSHDDGTNDQCKASDSANVVVAIYRNR